MTLRIAWYTTRGASSRAMFEVVLDAIRVGTLDAEIACVFSNRERGEEDVTDAFFDFVASQRIPLLSLSSVRFRRERGGTRSRSGEPLPAWRTAYDAEVARLVDQHPSDLGVLAGYMLIFTPAFVEHHPLLNLHPALPDGPAGTWREVIRHLIQKHAAESGVMVHVAIPAVDEGPVAAFARYGLRGEAFDALWDALPADVDDGGLDATPLFLRIRQAMVAHEAPFLVATLQAFADGRLRLEGDRIVGADGASPPPLDLTEDVRGRMSALPPPV